MSWMRAISVQAAWSATSTQRMASNSESFRRRPALRASISGMAARSWLKLIQQVINLICVVALHRPDDRVSQHELGTWGSAGKVDRTILELCPNLGPAAEQPATFRFP